MTESIGRLADFSELKKQPMTCQAKASTHLIGIKNYKEYPMTTEQKFLITYGLQHFVTFTQPDGEPTFTIQGEESQKMIRHATSLIQGSYGKPAHIQVS
jgi:hypothetical protein